MQKNRDIVLIKSQQVHWPYCTDREDIAFLDGSISVRFDGMTYVAAISEDQTVLTWSDGDTWTRVHACFLPSIEEEDSEVSSTKSDCGESTCSTVDLLEDADSPNESCLSSSCCGDSSFVSLDFLDEADHLDGRWIQKSGDVVVIKGEKVYWPQFLEPDNLTVGAGGVLSMNLYGETFVAELSAENTVMAWSDGDVWILASGCCCEADAKVVASIGLPPGLCLASMDGLAQATNPSWEVALQRCTAPIFAPACPAPLVSPRLPAVVACGPPAPLVSPRF